MYKRILHEGRMKYGRHVMIDADNCSNYQRSIGFWWEAVRELVKLIDMTAHGSPVIDEFGEGDEVGISLVQLITTSSITIHTNHLHQDVYLDVFSCKEFAASTVELFVVSLLGPEQYRVNEVIR